MSAIKAAFTALERLALQEIRYGEGACPIVLTGEFQCTRPIHRDGIHIAAAIIDGDHPVVVLVEVDHG